MKTEFTNIEIYENADSKGSLVGFTYQDLGINFHNIQIDIKTSRTVDTKELNGRYFYETEVNHEIIINEMDFITSQCDIFDAEDGYTEKEYDLNEDETKKLIEAISLHVIENIKDYVESED